MMPAAAKPNQSLSPRTGDIAPEFGLPDGAGRVWTLAELARGGSALLIFFRGVW